MAIVKFIKSKLFVGLCLLIVLTPTAFSKSLSNSLPYGWSKIKDMSNIKAINKKCEFDHSADYTNSDIEIFQKNCPLESISDYDIPENIKKEHSILGKKIYLYQSDKFSLFLEEKPITDPDIDPYFNSPTTILFLEKDDQIVDELTVSWHFTGEFGFTNELSYYIDKKFNIFIINHGVTEDGDWLKLWAHYKIDPQKIKFDAITVKTKREQIDFPDNLTVFANPDYDKNLGQLCLEEELNTECSEPNTYIDYFNEAKQNTALLVKRSKAPKNAFSLFKKKLDQRCITMPRFNNNEEGVLPYFKYLYLCEVNGLKQELIRIEKELAKK
ncbi:hypothetical protein [Gilliamella apicola]|uniref:Uncharacterized protein n=1 Tax=Gilliamella apicola TaxID=1196095 RepID=A0A2V4DTZ1_9GAMM|nr:hypothetical protein [Gilliamella apicola]PXZ04190.1 hypothetical protein DKK79_07435 [Gilliamella apicola]